MPISRPRAINGPISVMGAGPAMGQYISGLMAPRPTPRTALEGASQAAQSIGGALALGLMERSRRQQEDAANKQLSQIMSQGGSLDDWQKAWDALPEDQRDKNVGAYLGQLRGQVALNSAMQKPQYQKIGDELVQVNPDGTVRSVYRGSPELSGDAANLRAMLGRMPTPDEVRDFKNEPRYQAVQRTDAYGNQSVSVFDPRRGVFVGGSGGGGMSPGAMPAGLGGAPASVMGAAPSGAIPSGASPRSQGGPDSTNVTGQAFDSSGQSVGIPAGVKWQTPSDGRLPDGSLASVQWDKTGRFYRVLGPAIKPDKTADQIEKDNAAQATRDEEAENVIKHIDRSINLLNGKNAEGDSDGGLLPVAGVGGFLTGLPYSGAKELSGELETIGANLMFDKLAQMRANSATGASGLGQLSNREGEMLRNSWASVNQTNRPEVLIRNLNEIKQKFLNTIHGPGNWQMTPDGRVLIGKGIGTKQVTDSAGGQPSDMDSHAAALIKKYGGQ